MAEMTFRIDKSKELYKEDLRNALDVKNIERLKGKKVLITGATGLIGVCMIDALMSLGGVSVVAVGRDKGKAKERLGEYFDNRLFSFLEQDVTEPFPLRFMVTLSLVMTCLTKAIPDILISQLAGLHILSPKEQVRRCVSPTSQNTVRKSGLSVCVVSLDRLCLRATLRWLLSLSRMCLQERT